MDLRLEGVVAMVGSYGSGKSEVAVNLAVHHRRAGMKVRIADLDLVNPYFRSREAETQLTDLGIEVILPPAPYLQSELPVLSPVVAGVIRRPEGLAILDAGGDFDETYGVAVPSSGYNFFQGPIVPGAPTDSALFEGKWRYGAKNLGASSFVVYTYGTFAQIVDPPLGGATFPRVCYDYLLGKAGTIGTYLTFSGAPYNFFMSGDPLLPASSSNALPGNFPLGPFTGQDVRIMINSGPFTLAMGDTQEVVGSIVNGQGADRLASVTSLKLSDQTAQQAINNSSKVLVFN